MQQWDQYLLLCSSRTGSELPELENDLQQVIGVNVSDQTDFMKMGAQHPVVGTVLTAWHHGAQLAFSIK